MATLTADEIEYIRAMSGDDCVPYEVSNTLMQKLHDRGLGTPCGCAAADDVTVVLVLRARVARAIKLFDEEGGEAGGARSVSQKYDHLVEQLGIWEERCGLSGGVITIGSFDMGLDHEGDGAEYTSSAAWWSWGGWL